MQTIIRPVFVALVIVASACKTATPEPASEVKEVVPLVSGEVLLKGDDATAMAQIFERHRVVGTPEFLGMPASQGPCDFRRALISLVVSLDRRSDRATINGNAIQLTQEDYETSLRLILAAGIAPQPTGDGGKYYGAVVTQRVCAFNPQRWSIAALPSEPAATVASANDGL